MKKILFASLLGACVLGLYSHAGALADIPYKDPAHSSYFNYQSYLVQNGKNGETAQSWQALTVAERIAKVKEGEALLDKLHSELLAKQNRTPQDIALLEVVWGNNGTSAQADIRPHQSVVAGDKSHPIERVSAVSRNLESFQKNNNWNQLFDGDKNSAKGGGLAGAVAGYGNKEGAKLEPAPRPLNMKPLDAANIPPAGDGKSSPGKQTLPFAVGAIVAGLCAFGAKKIVDAGSSGSESDGPKAEKKSLRAKLVREAAFDQEAVASTFGFGKGSALSCDCPGSMAQLSCDCNSSSSKCRCGISSDLSCNCSSASDKQACNCSSSSDKQSCGCSSASSACNCSNSSDSCSCSGSTDKDS